MDYFPIFLNLNDEPCLVVGAGPVAARKVALLCRSGAAVHVVAPEASDAIRTAAAAQRLLDAYDLEVSGAVIDGLLEESSGKGSRLQELLLAGEACAALLDALLARAPSLQAAVTGMVERFGW